VLLNVTPDHLDRHGGMDGYIDAKRRIFDGQDASQTAVIGIDDDHCRRIHDDLKSDGGRTVLPISSEIVVKGGVYAPDGVLIDDTEGAAREALDLRNVATLPGRHNWQNAAAAYAAARGLGIAPEQAARALMSFPGLAHRMETVGVLGNVRFVNDSKATNADAARQALSSYPKVYWIAGGQAKTDGIDDLADLFPRVIKAYLVGDAQARFADTLKGKAEVAACGTIEAATRAAFNDAAASGEDAIVLLSPACASFDQFADFEQRGEAFRAAVQTIAAEHAIEGAA